jgi:hypothetical protein
MCCCNTQCTSPVLERATALLTFSTFVALLQSLAGNQTGDIYLDFSALLLALELNGLLMFVATLWIILL